MLNLDRRNIPLDVEKRAEILKSRHITFKLKVPGNILSRYIWKCRMLGIDPHVKLVEFMEEFGR